MMGQSLSSSGSRCRRFVSRLAVVTGALLITLPGALAGLARAQESGRRVYLPVAVQPRVDDWAVRGQLGGPLRAMTLDDARAYVVIGTRLVVVDLGSAYSVGESMPLATPPFDLVAKEDWLYALALDPNDLPELLAFDVHDADRPRLHGTLPLSPSPERTISLVDLGDHLAVSFSDRVELWAIGTPSLPRKVSSIPSPVQGNGRMAALNGQMVWLHGDLSGGAYSEVLDVIDLGASDPPRIVGRIALPATSDETLTMVGHYAIIGYGSRASLVDLAQPASPLWIGSVELPGKVDRLWAGTDRLYLAMHGLPAADSKVIAIWGAEWEAESPLEWELAPLHASVDAPLFDMLGSQLALARSCRGGHDELEVVDLARRVPARTIALTDMSAPGALVPAGRHMLAIPRGCPDTPDRLVVVDIAAAPWERTRVAGQVNLPTAGGVGGLLYQNGFAYLTVAEGLLVLDVRDPARPRLYDLVRNVSGRAFLDGQRLYMWGAVVRIFDLTTPGDADEIGSVDPPEGQAVTVWHGNLVSIDWDDGEADLHLLNAGDPAHPRRGGEVRITDGLSFSHLSWYFSLAAIDGAYTPSCTVGTDAMARTHEVPYALWTFATPAGRAGSTRLWTWGPCSAASNSGGRQTGMSS